jgi:hypothetical protein
MEGKQRAKELAGHWATKAVRRGAGVVRGRFAPIGHRPATGQAFFQSKAKACSSLVSVSFYSPSYIFH